jgi:hypothetical protein
MGVLETIRREKEKFQAKRELVKTKRLARDLEKSKRDYKRAQLQEVVNKNKEYAQKVKTETRERRLAPFKAFGKAISERTARRSRGSAPRLRGAPSNVFSGGSSGANIFTQSSGYNPIYHGGQGSANNPFQFSSSVKKKKR